MRINCICAVILFLALEVQADVGFGQGNITMTERGAPLKKVLEDISNITGMSYSVQSGIDAGSKPVTFAVKDATLTEVLDLVFKGQPVMYELVGNIIAVKKREIETSKRPADIDSGHVKAVRVQGTVYSESGEPLSGANVTIKETDLGTITNAKGEFDLRSIPAGSTVVFSFIGYAPQQSVFTDAANVKIYLKIAKNELDKVVIQAYGTTTNRLTTGSIATVSAAEIERQPTMNPLTALEGQVPGLVLTQDNGYASAPFKIEIRGRSGLDGSIPSEPLYVVDGVPLTLLETGNSGNYSAGSAGVTQNELPGPAGGQSPFFGINPGDIESISVLKDADATAIYGSRGANGVIIITTKRGKVGKTKLDINAYQGESAVVQHFSLMNTRQYLAMRWEAFRNDNIQPSIGNDYDLLSFDTTKYTDFQKALWGNLGKTTDVQVAVSGGDLQTTFRISGAYHRETNILSVSGSDQRGSVQFNLTHKSVDQRLVLSFTSLYSYTVSNLVNSPDAVTFAPDAPAFFTAPGQLNWNGWGLESNLLQGYAGELLQPYEANTGTLNSEINVQYDIIKGLHATVQLGYLTIHNSQQQSNPIKAQDPLSSPTGTADFGNNDFANAIVEPQLVYDRRISKGKLQILAGGTYQSASTNGNTIVGTGYTNDNLLNSIINAGAKNAFDDFVRYHYVAGFGRINYNWEDRYILNLTARRDGSSRFGPHKQYGNFGAVGAAWIFTETDWFKRNFPVLSFGKVRSSYGITGMDNIGNYQYLSQWQSGGLATYNGTSTFFPTLLANPDLQWQTNRKLEAAIDLGFLRDRITVEEAWYQNRCGNQLVLYNLPYVTGFSQVSANLPALVQNTGWESTVRAKVIDNSKLTWSVNFNIGVNRNKLVSFPNIAQSPYNSTYVVGKPLNIAWYVHYNGLDPLTGQYTFQSLAHNGTINPFVEPGVPNDLYVRDMSIKFDGGFGTSLRYKSWQLDILCHFRSQTSPASLSDYPGTTNDNQSTLFLNRWQKPGENAKYARYTTEPQRSDQIFYNLSDGVLSNGSYIRLQNVSLTYDFRQSWVRKIGMQGCRIYARGENLYLLTRYEGIDPDVPNFGSMPPSKIIVGGIQFTF